MLTLLFKHKIGDDISKAEILYWLCAADVYGNTSSDQMETHQNSDHHLSTLEQGGIILAELPNILGNRVPSRVTVLIPGQFVTCLNVALPKGVKRHADRATPYLIEEDLAAPIESFHIAIGEIDSDNNALVFAIDRYLMVDYAKAIGELPWPVDCLIPDYLIVPTGKKPRFARCVDKLLLRLPNGTGFVLETDSLPDIVNPSDWEEFPIEDLERHIAKCSGALTLLQGEFKSHAQPPSRSWIKTAGFSVAASLCLFLVYFAAAGLYFQQQSDSLKAEARQLYKHLFPEDRRIVNIRRQMEGHLTNKQTVSSSAFFIRLGELAGAVGNAGEAIQFRHLQFDRKDNHLVAELQAGSINVANNLRQQIKNRGGNAELLSVTKNDEGIIARIKIGG